jgi:GAF domain-containing protein
MQRAAEADIVSLYAYDADTRSYYAPCALGIPEDALFGALPDMQDQLARYLADEAQGKVPEELLPQHYGPNVWLTVTRRTLLARDAQREIPSSFIRRNRIRHALGLPLVAGDTLVGLLYLNFRDPEATGEPRGGRTRRKNPLDDARVAELEQEATRAAGAIARARDAEEHAAFAEIGRLAGQLGAPTGGAGEFRDRATRAVADLVEAAGFDGLAIYHRGAASNRLELVLERGVPAAPDTLAPPEDGGAELSEELQAALDSVGLHAVAQLPLRSVDQVRGVMALASRDRLAFLRRAPATRGLMQASADLLAGALDSARLYEDSRRRTEHLEIVADVSQAIASSIDLDQTLRLVARNMARLIDASLCLIGLYEEDGSAWYGAAASEDRLDQVWRRQRVERPERSLLFDVLDRRAPIVLEDAIASTDAAGYGALVFDLRSVLAVPLVVDEEAIGAVVLGQRGGVRKFTDEEIQRVETLARQAAVAIRNARLHALQEEEQHIQKDVVLLGFGQWGQRGYTFLTTLKQFFNFKTHVVIPAGALSDEKVAEVEARLQKHGDVLYLDSPARPAREQLRRELESSCYVVTYIATPAATHLPLLAEYYGLSNVVLIEKPLGAPLEAYRDFLATVPGDVEIVAADHYYFKLEVRLLQLLLTEERTLRTFLDEVEEIEVELLEQQPLTATSGAIGIIEDMLPHAFAIISLLTPIDRIAFDPDDGAADAPLLQVARYEPFEGRTATYARLTTSFPLRGRDVRLVIDVGKGVENAKWIRLNGERRPGSRRSFYKFDFNQGEAIDGTQTNLRAAVRPIRQPGVPDNAHLTMLRHTIERKHPAVGILAIREAMRSNQRIQELSAMADRLLAEGSYGTYQQGYRPAFGATAAIAKRGAAAAAD